MSQNNIDFEILDLGLVIYKSIIKDPEKIIQDVLDLNARYKKNEHGTAKTFLKDWDPWEYGDNRFCEKISIPEERFISNTDYYEKEQKSISNRLYSGLDLAFNHYSNVLYPIAGQNIKSREETIGLLRYTADGFLPAHADQGISSRILSSVSYLNDDYEGGEIEFVNSNIKIKPPAGSIIFFPSNFLYVHEVHTMTSGERYALPHWFHNRRQRIESDGTT